MPNRLRNILILGGTKEAADLAKDLHKQGHTITTSLAGRTKEPRPLAGAVRIGSFGGADGLAQFLTEQSFDQLIDATHPFAEQISANAKHAAKKAGVPLKSIRRPPWQKQPGDAWHSVPSIEAAAEILPKGSRVLLALGRQHIQPFAAREDVHFIIRMVDDPTERLPFTNHTLVLGRPSLAPDEEAELLKSHAITHIVCRNSGGKGAYAKIEAARWLKLPIIMIERPSA